MSLSKSTDTTKAVESISAIHEAGGHLVLCRARDEVVAGKIKKAKSPIWMRLAKAASSTGRFNST